MAPAKKKIDFNLLSEMMELRLPLITISRKLEVTRPTLQKIFEENNIIYTKYKCVYRMSVCCKLSLSH